jgi:hypothetical protein
MRLAANGVPMKRNAGCRSKSEWMSIPGSRMSATGLGCVKTQTCCGAATRTAVAEASYKRMLIDAGIEPTLDSCGSAHKQLPFVIRNGGPVRIGQAVLSHRPVNFNQPWDI